MEKVAGAKKGRDGRETCLPGSSNLLNCKWMSENPPPARPKRRRRWIAWAVLVLLAWRAWPLAGTLIGWNVQVSEAPGVPDASILPPAAVPDELRSGRSRLGRNGVKLAGETIFLPRAIRHGHTFKCDDPALPEATAKQLAELLADPASYEAWAGEKMCGGFHGDWYLRWGEGAESHEVIVCMGCGEAILYHAGKSLRCDLKSAAYKRIGELTERSVDP